MPLSQSNAGMYYANNLLNVYNRLKLTLSNKYPINVENYIRI